MTTTEQLKTPGRENVGTRLDEEPKKNELLLAKNEHAQVEKDSSMTRVSVKVGEECTWIYLGFFVYGKTCRSVFEDEDQIEQENVGTQLDEESKNNELLLAKNEHDQVEEVSCITRVSVKVREECSRLYFGFFIYGMKCRGVFEDEDQIDLGCVNRKNAEKVEKETKKGFLEHKVGDAFLSKEE
jgi:hypothetical protein